MELLAVVVEGQAGPEAHLEIEADRLVAIPHTHGDLLAAVPADGFRHARQGVEVDNQLQGIDGVAVSQVGNDHQEDAAGGEPGGLAGVGDALDLVHRRMGFEEQALVIPGVTQRWRCAGVRRRSAPAWRRFPAGARPGWRRAGPPASGPGRRQELGDAPGRQGVGQMAGVVAAVLEAHLDGVGRHLDQLAGGAAALSTLALSQTAPAGSQVLSVVVSPGRTRETMPLARSERLVSMAEFPRRRGRQ